MEVQDHVQDGVICPAKGLLIELGHKVRNRDLSTVVIDVVVDFLLSRGQPDVHGQLIRSADRVQQCRLALRIVLRFTVVSEYSLNVLVQNRLPPILGIGPGDFIGLHDAVLTHESGFREFAPEPLQDAGLEVFVAQLETLIGLRSASGLTSGSVNNQVFVGLAKQLEITLQFPIGLEPLVETDHQGVRCHVHGQLLQCLVLIEGNGDIKLPTLEDDFFLDPEPDTDLVAAQIVLLTELCHGRQKVIVERLELFVQCGTHSFNQCLHLHLVLVEEEETSIFFPDDALLLQALQYLSDLSLEGHLVDVHPVHEQDGDVFHRGREGLSVLLQHVGHHEKCLNHATGHRIFFDIGEFQRRIQCRRTCMGQVLLE